MMYIKRLGTEFRDAFKIATRQLMHYYKTEFGIKPDSFVRKSRKDNYVSSLYKISQSLDIKLEDAEKIFLVRTSTKGMDFYTNVAAKLQTESLNRGTDEQTNQCGTEILKQLAEIIDTPTKSHYQILDASNYNLEDKIELLKDTADPKIADLIAKLTSIKDVDGKSLNLPAKTILDITSLKNILVLCEEFDRYSSLIACKGKSENFVQELEKQLANPNISDLSAMDNIIQLNKLKRLYPAIDYISQEANLASAPYGLKLISQSEQYLDLDLSDSKTINEDFKDFLKNLVMTTTEKNYKIRQLFVKTFSRQISAQKVPVKMIDVFLTKLDTDENFYKLFEKLSKKQALNPNIRLSELMYYADVVGAKNLLNNIDRFINMINESPLARNNPNNVAIRLCRHVNNKYYLTYKEETALINKEKSLSNRPIGIIRSYITRLMRISKDKISDKHQKDALINPLIDIKYETYLAKIMGTEVKPAPKSIAVTPTDKGIKPNQTETPDNVASKVKDPGAEPASTSGVTTDETPKPNTQTSDIQTPQPTEPLNVDTPKPQGSENPDRILSEQSGEKISKTDTNNKKIIPWIIGALAGITAGSAIANNNKK